MACPCCTSPRIRVFHEVVGVPVNDVLLLRTREEALRFPVGDIRLGHCQGCGFIFNTAFDASLLEYSSRYEETQGFSPTFQEFHRDLAGRLIDRYDLRGKRVLEIGCGKGEFLALLCEMGGCEGIGFDPVYDPGRLADDRVRFVRELYSEEHREERADFICCKMTLEHIGRTAEFVGMVRRALDDQMESTVLFQVPDVTRILEEIAFWDIFYEHCSYFSPGSLARLFLRCRFDVLSVERAYDGQYILLEARPGTGSGEAPDDLESIGDGVRGFESGIRGQVEKWGDRIRGEADRGRRIVIWGAGSKGVAFLTTLGIRDRIRYAVDINPHKQGCFLAGTGQEVVGPEILRTYRPDLVIIMNPVYREEIEGDLRRMGLDPEVITT